MAIHWKEGNCSGNYWYLLYIMHRKKTTLTWSYAASIQHQLLSPATDAQSTAPAHWPVLLCLDCSLPLAHSAVSDGCRPGSQQCDHTWWAEKPSDMVGTARGVPKKRLRNLLFVWSLIKVNFILASWVGTAGFNNIGNTASFLQPWQCGFLCFAAIS